MRKNIESKILPLYKLKHDAIAKRKGKPQEAAQSEQQEHEGQANDGDEEGGGGAAQLWGPEEVEELLRLAPCEEEDPDEKENLASARVVYHAAFDIASFVEEYFDQEKPCLVVKSEEGGIVKQVGDEEDVSREENLGCWHVTGTWKDTEQWQAMSAKNMHHHQKKKMRTLDYSALYDQFPHPLRTAGKSGQIGQSKPVRIGWGCDHDIYRGFRELAAMCTPEDESQDHAAQPEQAADSGPVRTIPKLSELPQGIDAFGPFQSYYVGCAPRSSDRQDYNKMLSEQWILYKQQDPYWINRMQDADYKATASSVQDAVRKTLDAAPAEGRPLPKLSELPQSIERFSLFQAHYSGCAPLERVAHTKMLSEQWVLYKKQDAHWIEESAKIPAVVVDKCTCRRPGALARMHSLTALGRAVGRAHHRCTDEGVAGAEREAGVCVRRLQPVV